MHKMTLHRTQIKRQNSAVQQNKLLLNILALRGFFGPKSLAYAKMCSAIYLFLHHPPDDRYPKHKAGKGEAGRVGFDPALDIPLATKLREP